MRHASPNALLPLVVLLAGACGGADPVDAHEDDGPPTVHTTFYPTAYFAERIGGDAIEVVCPVPPDADAIFWQPSDADLLAYQEADLVVLNGAGFAKWVAGANLPSSRVVDTAAGFEDEFVRYEEGVSHSHGGGEEHTHEGLDGHTWVDPVNAERQARALLDALVARWPDQADDLRQGFAGLAADLGELHARLEALAPRLRGTTVLASHPAYNYVAQRYAVEIVNFDLDPEAPLTDDDVAAIAAAAGEGAVMLWEGEPLPANVARLADEADVASTTFSPCELLEPDSGEDYLSVMRANLDALESVLP